jgi:hypothetical protein
MSSRPFLACFVALVASSSRPCSAAGAEPPASTAGQKFSVAELVERLASPERSERIAAEQELLRRGPDVLESLPRESADPAVRDAVTRLRKRLEIERAEQAVRPTLISLHGSGPAGDVLKGDLPLTPAQAARPVFFDVEKQPYWGVTDDIARQIGGWPGPVSSAGLTFRDRTPEDDAKQIGYAGAFRIAAGPVTTKPTPTPGRQLVRVPVEVRAEPRLRPLFLTCAAKDVTLTGPDAKSLPPFTPDARYELPFGERGGEADITLDFVADADPAGPWTLTGRFVATVAAGEERFAFPLDHNGPREATHGGVCVRLREATRRPDGTAEFELAVLYDRGGPAFESYRTWVYHNEATLRYALATDGDRQTVCLNHQPGFDTVAQSNGGVVLRYRFGGIPSQAEEVTFEYVAPTKIVEAPLTVSINDLTVHPRPNP